MPTTFPDIDWTNPWMDWLESSREGRRASWEAFARPFAKGMTRSRAVRDLFDQVEREFQAELASQTYGGGAPTRRFGDYMQKFPIADRILRQAGTYGDPTLNPRTRFIMP